VIDLDNMVKFLGDAIKGHLFGDDRNIMELHAYKEEVRADPSIEFTVAELVGHE
jgi:Holliday junction resolvase RusA-like endonuclease